MSALSTKREKIASALYLITSFFDDKEPLKWRVRSLATDLLSDSIKVKLPMTREVSALLAMAKSVGLVSEMNYNILHPELIKLMNESENSLDLAFFQETPINERSLPEPQKAEHVKDNILEKRELKTFGAVSVKKNSRQSIIISILKRKREIMIKDVTPLISGCSEKTIQRELSGMVASGVLRKVGEKRWSRYSLA